MKIVIKEHDKEREFIVIFCFWFIISLLSMTNLYKILGNGINWLNNIVDYLALVLLILYIIFMHKYKIGELAELAITGGIVFVVTVISGNTTLISTMIFVVAAKEIDINKIIALVYKILILFVPFTMLLAIVKLIPSMTMIRANGIYRTSLGFTHPNKLGIIVFELFVCYFWLHRDEVTWWRYLIGLAGVFFIWRVPNSQTSGIALLLFIVLIFLFHILQESKKRNYLPFFGSILIVGTLAANVISVIFMLINVHAYKVLSLLDIVLTYRFYYAHISYQHYGVRLWGQPTDFSHVYNISGVKLICDNSYANLLIMYGIMGYLLFSGLYLLIMIRMKRHCNYAELIIYFVYAVYGIMESNMFSLESNIFLFMMSQFLYMRDKYAENLPYFNGGLFKWRNNGI